MSDAAQIVLLALGLFWVSSSLLVAYVAIERGRSGTRWAWAALLLVTPPLALLALIALPARAPRGTQNPL